ncbi:MAG: hypothetical protein DRP01_08795 [Archaeoglobales archaeon]|nr:MAG: hypothetical protein DRP01_08795 [Archaeoglobales archaeon]
MPSATIGTTATKVLERNAERKSLYFRNQSTSGQKIYIDNTTPGGLTTTNAGYVLSTGDTLTFALFFDGEDIESPWSAIADASGATLFYKELSERPEES